MKITKMNLTAITIPLKEKFQVSFRFVTDTNVIILELETDEGITGVGEVVPLPRFNGQTVESITAAIDRYMRPYIIGENPFKINKIINRISKAVIENNPAVCAVDLALHDLVARSQNVPVVDLLGGEVRDKILAVIEMPIEKPSKSVKRAKNIIEYGFKALKPKVGFNPYEDAERVIAIRKAVGKDVIIRVDVNQAWTIDQTLQFIKVTELEDARIELIEQPLPKWDLEGLAYLRTKTDIPIMVDESVFTTQDALNVIKNKSADIINIKQNKSGGIIGSMKVAALAESAGIDYLIGVDDPLGIGTAMKVHMGCALEKLKRACEFTEYMVYSDYIVKKPVPCRDGYVILPEGPGFGVELDLKKISKYKTDVGTVRTEKRG